MTTPTYHGGAGTITDDRWMAEILWPEAFTMTCTVQAPVRVDQPSGQSLTTSWQTVAGCDNVRCAVLANQGQERRALELTEEIDDLRIVLAGYYPQLLAGGPTPAPILPGHPATYRALLSDGRACDIMDVDHGVLREHTSLVARTSFPEAVPGE